MAEDYHPLGNWREPVTGDVWTWEQVARQGPEAPFRIRRVSDGETRSVTRQEFPAAGWERVEAS